MIYARLSSLIGRPITAFASKPSAISVPVSPNWLGLDGNWSPVSIRVGTPPQWIDVLVSTASQETWAVGGGGCDGTDKCTRERGGLFEIRNSSSWLEGGYAALGLDLQLGFGGYGRYGFDSIALSDHVSVPEQIVAVINTTEYWTGFLGLGIKATNFTDANRLTFLSSLIENQSLIPSHSYGYTAGAYYRLKGVPASLTLGGFDAARFESHDISFDLDANQEPVVAINQITVTAQPLAASNISTGWSENRTTLLSTADSAFFTLDSSTPYLWLPESVCDRVEKSLGLVYDPKLELYTFQQNTTQYETLKNWNLTFDFTISDLPNSANEITLSLPYATFDSQLEYPFPGLNATEFSEPTKYFPLRRAKNDTQFTLGRTFMQETYLIVDYERNNFSVYQAKFASNAVLKRTLVDISRPRNSTLKGPGELHGSRLNTRSLVGIAIGASVALLSLIALIAIYRHWCCFARKNQGEQGRKSGITSKWHHCGPLRWLHVAPRRISTQEVDGSLEYAKEFPTDCEIVELPPSDAKELHGSQVNTPVCYHEGKKHAINIISPIGHDPVTLVELEDHSNAPGEKTLTVRQKLVPYSADFVGRHGSQSPSVSSRSNEGSRASTAVVSPVTPKFHEHLHL
ncbi:MAG: hypothetical protein LQ351_002626 [Letrouitia transgressa]|nr:MAG: hypothetical protein LQ351_002626 [Letrouitia transgressa]